MLELKVEHKLERRSFKPYIAAQSSPTKNTQNNTPSNNLKDIRTK